MSELELLWAAIGLASCGAITWFIFWVVKIIDRKTGGSISKEIDSSIRTAKRRFNEEGEFPWYLF